MTKLISFHCDDIPQLGRIGLQRCAEPMGPLTDHAISLEGKVERLGWSVSIRGAAMFLLSPPGWSRNAPASQWSRTGPRRVFEVPRNQVKLEWETDDFAHLEKGIQRYDSEPMVRRAAEVPALNQKDVGDA